ncbi:MAG: hypothetical protein KF712_05175 [Akkermansiaceae bacterium]|nr:hypothetical protein [Akkermansiaceae bacterium]
MKKPLILSIAGILGMAAPAQAAILIAYTSFPDEETATTASTETITAQVAAAGFSGRVVQPGFDFRTSGGSNDGTYGPSLSTGESGGNGYIRVNAGSILTITVTNSSGAAVQLGTLLFDTTYTGTAGTIELAYRFDGTGAYTVLESGLVSDTAVTGSGAAAAANYRDQSVDVSSLSLNNGQSITFQFSPVGSGSSFRVDNVALLDIPEPSLALLAAAGIIPLLRRRVR